MSSLPRSANKALPKLLFSCLFPKSELTCNYCNVDLSSVAMLSSMFPLNLELQTPFPLVNKSMDQKQLFFSPLWLLS